MDADVDIFIIGGGINGCGIARDAAGRGYSVYLAEMNDLASGTSSWSTKLIHGGLRYLEHGAVRLVREALIERELLWRNAPHIIAPMRFVLPHHSGLRPAWMLRLGLFLYDHLGGRKALPPCRTLDLGRDPAGSIVEDRFRRAFEYSDCFVDDARLVVLNARDAADRGAVIAPRTRVVRAGRENDEWLVEVENDAGVHDMVRAKALVNAAGPWVDHVLRDAVGTNTPRNVRLVRGSHIVVPRFHNDDRAFVFQNADGRIVFVIPYERDFALIGTTDRDHHDDPGAVAITQAETDYLVNAVNVYLKAEIQASDIVWTFSGVRPLYDDGATKAQEATRDYVLKAEMAGALLLNVFGGKITTYRRLAEAAMTHIEGALGRRRPGWTGAAPLPGGDFPIDGRDGLVEALCRDCSHLDHKLAARLVRLYGTRARAIVANTKTVDDLGRLFGADLHQVEVDHLIDREWAHSAEDILWRRTKLGLLFNDEQIRALETYVASRGAKARSAAE